MSDDRMQQRVDRSVARITECGCWIWMGAIGGRGYGSLCFEAKRWRAHRFSWTAYIGDIPDEAQVLHRCDVPSCVNPSHLFLGDSFENMQDKERKGRGNHATGHRNARHTMPWRTCRGDNHPLRKNSERVRGEGNGRAVLSKQDVIEIRNSSLSGAALGRQFGITRKQANQIKARKAWKHL